MINTEVIPVVIDFWKEKIKHIPPGTVIPPYTKRSSVYSARRSTEHFELPAGIAGQHSNIEHEFLTAVLLILSRYNNNTELVVGIHLQDKTNTDALRSSSG